MALDRISVRALGLFQDTGGRLYDVLSVDGDGHTRRVVLQRGALASPRRFRKRLSSLGVLLPSEGRSAKSLAHALLERDAAEPVVVQDHLGWVNIASERSVFLLDEGYVDQEGWHDTLPFEGGPLPRMTANPEDIAVVSDAALWQPTMSGSAWEGYDKPPTPPLLTGWRPTGSWEDWAGWFAEAPKPVRSIICAVLAPVALHGLIANPPHTHAPMVVAVVGSNSLSMLQAGVSPWAGPRAGLFWPDARLQDLERQAGRMRELPLAYQEADATTRSKIYSLVRQYESGMTRGRSQSTGLETLSIRGTLLLECSKSIMTPTSGMQDTTLQFSNLPGIQPPRSYGVAGPQVVKRVLHRSAAQVEDLQQELKRLEERFRELRISLGFEKSRTWRLDFRHAAVELTHRVLVRDHDVTGEFEEDEGMLTEWREPMTAAGEAEVARHK